MQGPLLYGQNVHFVRFHDPRSTDRWISVEMRSIPRVVEHVAHVYPAPCALLEPMHLRMSIRGSGSRYEVIGPIAYPALGTPVALSGTRKRPLA